MDVTASFPLHLSKNEAEMIEGRQLMQNLTNNTSSNMQLQPATPVMQRLDLPRNFTELGGLYQASLWEHRKGVSTIRNL